MIVTKLISGLGNQLFQYAMGRQLALMNEVPLQLDISFFDTQELRSYRLNNYNIEASLATEKIIDRYLYRYTNNNLHTKILRRTENLKPSYQRKRYRQSNWWAYEPEAMKVASNIYLEGYWQHHKYFENLPGKVFQELTLSQPLTLEAESLRTNIAADELSVSVHVRRGDYITDEEAKTRIGVLPLEYYSKAIQIIHEKIALPRFFVFSDDMGWAKEHLPLPASTTFVELEDGKLDYVELELMSKCSHNIIANSSFSWWGAFLNRQPGKIVIAPRRWSGIESLNQNIELQFPSWITI